jgi:hypothetical protein
MIWKFIYHELFHTSLSKSHFKLGCLIFHWKADFFFVHTKSQNENFFSAALFFFEDFLGRRTKTMKGRKKKIGNVSVLNDAWNSKWEGFHMLRWNFHFNISFNLTIFTAENWMCFASMNNFQLLFFFLLFYFTQLTSQTTI